MDNKIIDTIYVLGRGTILVMLGNYKDYKIGDIIFDKYEIRGIEYSQYSNKFGLIVKQAEQAK